MCSTLISVYSTLISLYSTLISVYSSLISVYIIIYVYSVKHTNKCVQQTAQHIVNSTALITDRVMQERSGGFLSVLEKVLTQFPEEREDSVRSILAQVE